MLPGTRITIEIGKTSIKNGSSITELIINGKEEQCIINPARWATDQNILASIVKNKALYEFDKNLES